jgi:dTDP-4-dehydrorhamnose reductase
MEMLNKKILIIGSDGIIGTGIKNSNLYTKDIEYFSRSSNNNFFDLNSLDSINFNYFNENHIVIFLSAISKPGLCEKDKFNSYKINVVNTAEAIKKIINNGSHVIFSSTDMVYGYNEDKLYHENDELNPSCNYSEWKAIIEQMFLSNIKFSTIRFSQCINIHDSFSKYIQDCIINKKEIELYNNFKRNIFDSSLITNLIATILKNGVKFKTLNIGGDENVNRLAFEKWIHPFYQNIKLINFKNNQKELISTIRISNDNLKKFLSLEKINFDYNNWINNIKINL